MSELSHVYPLGSRVNDLGHLELGGCDAIELAREFGTPAYVVAEDDLRARARAFADALAARHRDYDVLFASKAFPCTAVYRVLADEGLACDVASGGELALALSAGFDAQRTYMHGNAKSEGELREALAAGVGHIVLDSRRRDRPAGRDRRRHRDPPGRAHPRHARRLGRHPPRDLHRPGRLQVRLLARAGPRGDRGDSTVTRGSTFRACTSTSGHSCSSSRRFAPPCGAIASLGRFPVYNLGGGLAAAYTPDQQPPSPERWVEAIVDAVHAELGPDVRLLLEPGRALVANSTVTLYTVQTIKRNVSTWVAVDGGMSDNLRPMMYGARYEAVIADRPLTAGDTVCHVAGKHCESGDVIVRDAKLPAPAPGDVVVTPATGAYGYAMANNYNGVPRPPVVFVRDGEARVVVRRETYADLMSRDVS